MGRAALVILLVSVAATAVWTIVVRSGVDASIEFGTLLLNSLSLLWLGFVLAKNESVTDAKFGRAVRKEMSTVVLALSTLLIYSVVRLIKLAIS